MLRREVGPVEVVEAFLARIDEFDPLVNAVVVRRREEARREARAAEAALLAGGDVGALHGVPITVKEAIAVEGMPWTSGSRLREGIVAERDAGAVRRLRRAGAIVIGMTNVPEFCFWYDTDNDLYGRTRNPHGPARSPGGSSGGEAAALALRLAPLGVGSDLGSSIRQPAAWTGIFGLKPSRDLVPPDGHAGFGLSFGIRAFMSLGPMARTVDDLDLALRAMASRPAAQSPGGIPRVAVFEDDGLQPVARSCRAAVRRAADALAAAGLGVIDERPPHQEEIRQMYDRILHTEARLLVWPTVEGRVAELSEYGRRALGGLGGVVPDPGAYVEAAARLHEIVVGSDAWLEDRPVVICPVVPLTAPLAAEGIVEIDGEPARPGGKLTLCTWANALGLPAASVPCGRDDDGLPLAVQVIGRRGFDGDVLDVARTLEASLGGAVEPNLAWASAPGGLDGVSE